MRTRSAERRRRDIVSAVERDGRVTVAELAASHRVAVETIRRDLTALDREGSLHKVHGGAVPAPAIALPETGVSERERAQAAAKARIARRALPALGLRDGSTLLLDAGTSTSALAAVLPSGLELTVLTSSVLIAAALANRPRTVVHIIGGRVRGLTQAAVGPTSVEALAGLRADVSVLGANGLSAEHGLSTPDPDEAAVKHAIAAAGRRVVALIDATKVGQEHLVSFADPDDVDVLVTDAPLPAPLAARLADSGTEVLIA